MKRFLPLSNYQSQAKDDTKKMKTRKKKTLKSLFEETIKPDYSTTNGVILVKRRKRKIICSTTNGINKGWENWKHQQIDKIKTKKIWRKRQEVHKEEEKNVDAEKRER